MDNAETLVMDLLEVKGIKTEMIFEVDLQSRLFPIKEK